MSNTVGDLVVGLRLASTVNQDGEKAKADARKLKKEMDSILAIGTPLSFSASKNLVHNEQTLFGSVYNAARKAQIQGMTAQSMSMFGTGAMGRAASMPQRDFVAMAMKSWEKNKAAEVKKQIEVGDEIAKREDKTWKSTVTLASKQQEDAARKASQIEAAWSQHSANQSVVAAQMSSMWNKQDSANKTKTQTAEAMWQAKELKEKANTKQQVKWQDEVAVYEADVAKRVATGRKASAKKADAEFKKWESENKKQASNAARMDPANNLRRGFVGGMFGSPVGTASTIGMSAMVGAAAGFMGGMAASMVISGIGRIKDAVIGLGVETIKTGSSVELLKLRLDTITKGEGTKYFNELLQTAIDLRSPIEGVITSFSKMTAMGFQPTMDQLKGLVNYTRMLGDPQNLDYIVLAFSQIASKGKLEMQELRQLAERGVPALSIIMEKFKLKPGSIGDIGKLFIPGTKAVQALLEGIKERVGDIGTKWKDTMQSSVDYIKLLWWQFKKEMGDTGMFDSFKSLLKEMTVAMSAPGFKDMAKDIGTAFDVLFKSLEKVTSFTKENWVWLGPVLGYFAKSTKLGDVYTIGKLVAQKTGMFAENPWTLTEDDVRRKKKENSPSIDRLLEEQAQLKGFKSQLGEFSVEMGLSGWGKKKAELESSWEKMMKEAATMPGSIAEEAMKAARIARSDSVSKAAKDWITVVMSDVTDSFSSLMDSFGDKQTKDIRKWNEKMDKLIKSLKEGPQTSDAISAIKEAEGRKRTGGNLIRDTYLEEFQKDTKQAWKDFYEDLTTINLTGLERQIYDVDKKAQEMLTANIIPDADIETWRKMKIDQIMRENRPEPTQLSAYVVGTEAANRMQYGGTSQNTFSTIAKNTGETSKEITKLRESIERKRSEPVSGASQDILDAFGL